MSGFIKYFDNGEKNMSLMIKEIKGIKFHSNHVYDEKYVKAKIREYNGVIKQTFFGNEVPKEGVHYTYIACINIDSVMKMDIKIIHKFN